MGYTDREKFDPIVEIKKSEFGSVWCQFLFTQVKMGYYSEHDESPKQGR